MTTHWWAFVPAAAALITIPGPDVLVVLRNAITGGRRGGLATGFGTSTGILVHAGAAAAGVSALLAASATAFTVAKIVGATFWVLWLFALAVGAGRTCRVLSRRPVRRGVKAFAGTLFIGFGVRLVVAP